MLWMTPAFVHFLSIEENPSKIVRDFFAATLLMLGYKQSHVKVSNTFLLFVYSLYTCTVYEYNHVFVFTFQEWSEIKKFLVDDTTLKHRILVFNHNILTNKNPNDARTLIENISIEELYVACPGLATFYCWVKLNLLIHFQGFKIISVEMLL